MKRLLTLDELSLVEINEILSIAQQLENGAFFTQNSSITVANLFFEPSTRTKCSFEMAEKELGLQSLFFDVASSSVQKGESLYDTVKTLEAMGCKAVVIRHPQKGYYQELSNIQIPIINAGDGTGDHPTQSLLDLLTIQQQFHRFHNLNVVICGDIRHSRVARTNANILRRLGANVYFSGPIEWMDGEITKGNVISMDDAVDIADVFMLLRIQTERHDEIQHWTNEEYHHLFGLTAEREKRMRDTSIIMHPGPVNRDVEIASELVECSKSRIFKQVRNGVLIRKAVLAKALNLFGGKKYGRAI